MRLHPLAIFLSIPAIFLACSDGGPGSAQSPGGPSAFGQSGATVPALAPGGPASTGEVPNPQVDSGQQQQDTGGGTDTKPATDTGGGGDPVCARPSKCSDTFIPPDICNAQITKCGSVARTYFTCLSDNQVCKTDGSNTTDAAATTAACSAEGEAYTAACSG